ncbi:MAG TPA: cytochrome c oxidase subunit 4 [Chloroflexota bacterium]|nr:cytochrome c oxidase subunit 4 [Chloroflexota bacterium]
MSIEGPAAPPGGAPPLTPITEEVPTAQHEVHLPPLSVWPVTLAAAITIAAAGLVTIWPVSLVGGIVGVYAIVEWVRELFHEHDHAGTH